ncbi:MAG TPA: AI-2E family transporter [Longimicrobium sp.]|nr:AI-2E family transporter [Longimicrobium sp.]
MINQIRRGPLPFLLGGASVVILITGLRAASGMLNPVLMAAFLALLFQSSVRALRRRRVPGALAVGGVVLAVVLGGLLVVGFLAASLRQLALDFPRYRAGLEGLVVSLTRSLEARGIDAARYLETAIEGPRVGQAILDISTATAGMAGNLLLTLFIFAFMLGGMVRLEDRVAAGDREGGEMAARFMAFSETIRGYMGVRAVLGLIAAALDVVLLWIVGVEYALVWGMLSFILSFVPNIGFTLSVIPPVLLALVGLGWQAAVIVLAGYMVINNVMDNVIGPRYVGREMNMSPLLSFLSVIFWAWVLGPSGAILAVPLTVLVRELAFGPPPAPAPAAAPAVTPPPPPPVAAAPPAVVG